ncbi:PAS domain S-box protein [Halorussus lipolyticus]|uniref:PAS domain S-box protein n=1 Tax=Halorussus lipolyticus TaxID=3034024 RepID=UPI0023E8AEC3|nr:PAS domain S-box protein [Halorussus sp. DT80]
MAERARSGAAFWADADDAEALERYRTLVNAIDDGIYQLDPDGRFVAVNDVITETTGYDREELVGSHVSMLLDAEAVSAIEREIERRLSDASDKPETFEFSVRTADGDRVPCELRLNLLVSGGEFRGSIGVVRDVSDRKRTERTLTERERQLARESDLNDRILEASPVGIVVVDSDREVVRVNERGRRLLGISEDERDGFSPADRPTYDEEGRPIPPDEYPSARAFETGEAVYDRTLQIERPDGERRWLSVNAVPITDADGEVDRVITTGEDVTDLKERERRLKGELEDVFGRVTDAFYALDDDWKFTHANEHAEDLIDYQDEGLVGRNFWDVFEWATDSKLGDEYRTAMETQEQTSFEFYYPEPLEAWYEVHAYPSETGLSVYFRDITDRKRRERELEESERRYRTLIENFPNGAVALVDEDFRYVTFGGTPEGDADVTSDELEGRHLREGLPEELADVVAPHYEAALDGETATFEETIDGKIYQFYFLPVRDADGEVFAALGMSQDVTEREKYRNRLEASERRYRTLVENFPNGIVTLFDRDLRYTLAEGRGFEEIPVEPDDLEGEHFQDVWNETTAEDIRPAFESALDGEERSVELEYVGREWVVRAVPITDERGEVFAGMTMAQDITEQKRQERELREAKSQLEAATEAGAVGTWEWHIEDDKMVTGASFARTFGVDPESARDGVSLDRFIDAIHEDDRERVEQEIDRVLETCGEYEEEYRVTDAEGNLRWVVARGTVECDDEGNPVTFPGALADITKRKRAEQELEEHRRQLETLFEVLPVGVVVADEDGRLVEANEAAKEIWGGDVFDAECVTDYDRYRGWWADTGEPVAADEWTMARVLDGEEVSDPDIYEIATADGESRTIMVHGMPVRDEKGEVVRGVVTQTDITDRREYRRQLEASERRYRALAENFPDGGVGVYDRNLTYTLVTGTMWDDIEPDAEEIEGNHAEDVLPPGTWDDVEPLFRSALDGETGSVVSTLGGRTYRVWATPLRDADGEIRAGQSFALDITEQIEREQKLEETVEKLEESNERLESFASMLAHELRNPVTIGQIYSQQLPEGDSSEAVEYVTEAFDRIEDMINVMLVLTRGREAVGESTLVSLSEMARDAWAGIDAPEAEIEVNADGVTPADETYIQHLLRNLFENAVQHGGDDVTVEIGDLPTGFYVADDGCGIPPEDRETVFEAGFTTAANEGGTGLGLAFVEELADVYEWSVSVTESEAGGARFEFRNVDLVASA